MNLFQLLETGHRHKRNFIKVAGLFVFMVFALSSTYATVNLSIHNTGCQDVKVYKKDWGWETYQTTVHAGDSWSVTTWYNQEWVFRHTNGDYIGNYHCGISSSQSHDCDSGGCSGGGGCTTVPSSIPGFIYMGEHNGSKYFCSDDSNNSWADALAEIASHGGHLAVINDADENNFIKSHINASHAWIGWTDEIVEGVFEWINGSTHSYSNWSSGEPNDEGPGGPGADHTVIGKSDGKWYDRHGGDHYEYVMEIPCNPTPPTGGNCMDELAYWDLDACTAGSSYNEFTADVNTPAGFASVNASIFSNIGDHSCSYGESGEAMCHAIKDGCSWSNNNSNAYKFSVTLKPTSGNTATLSKLNFYEKAPSTYSWVGGGSGDNDPPSKYGVRVTVNGTQVFKEVDLATSGSWSLEEFDFSSDPDFTVSSETTFDFEILGYCRQGSYGYAVWDIDEIKVFGCAEGPCANAGGDSDGDSVCDDDDCAPNDPSLPATPGTACNDGNPNTVNDVILADGCSCEGTFDPCAANGGDTDGDGTCDNDDCAPNDPSLPAAPGTACDDGNPNTSNDQIQADGCTCAGTTQPPVCDNITNGGTIGFGGSCLASISVTCNTAAPVIGNCVSPTGGSGALETIWLKSTTSCTTPTTTAADIIAGLDPHWVWIAGETGLTYNPGIVTENTCYLRCTRRAGCTTYAESNIISLDTDCGGGGGDPDCADIGISADAGSITVSGLDGAPISSLQIFNSSWGQEFSCFANCGATETVSLPAGDYLVYAKYYTAGYGLICQVEETVTVGGGGGGCQPGNPCDDGDLCTINDTYDLDCNCVGTADADLDGDGTCDAADCQPNNAAYPATPGTACDDGNPNTVNDQITADGCGCIGTPGGGGGDPDCADIVISTDAGSITVSGLDGAPVSSLQIFNSSWGQEFSCFANCGASETVSLPAGDYLVYAKYYTSGYGLICQVEETVTVGGGGGGPCAGQGGDSDGDGVCDNDDCQPNNANYPATPGSACNDGNPNTTNDQVTADGCGCEGTPSTDPCASAGGDSDGDGVCNNDDCQPFNANFPATPGTTCDDGNANTTNDVVTADGCGCEGTPTGGGDPDCADISITTGAGSVTVSGLDGAPVSSLQIFNSSWGQEFSCFANCGATETVSLPAGDYLVYAKYYTSGYGLICQVEETVTVGGGGDPCASAGGDSDGDGICDNDDCQPNNANFPATPGSACNDGNPNTENDVVTADGCGCAGTPIQTGPCTPSTLVTWNLDACASCTSGSNADWSELTASVSSNAGCSNVSATSVSPTSSGSEHSCTPGQSNTAMCIGADTKIKFEVTMDGNDGKLSSLSFYEQAPDTYLWDSPNNNCGGPVSGSNNRPTKFDLKVYKNGSLVFSTTENTQHSWNLRTFDFSGNAAFDVSGSTTFRFELKPHTPESWFGSVKAWDIDEISVMGCCGSNGGGGGTQPIVAAPNHPKFVNSLPNIPRIDATNGGTYNIGMEESNQWLGLMDANGNPVNSTVWGYTFNNNQMYLGPTFITKENVPVNVKWINNLPMTHLLPVDNSIHMARPNAGIPTVVHLHGGHTEPESDGYPEAWFTQNWAETGAEFAKQTYHYSNDQEASPLWYHDHTLGMTRLNVYAGLAGMYLLRDQNELSLDLPTGQYERELVIQDKQFAADGSLYFPSKLTDPEAQDFPTNPAIEPTIFPEFFGDYILVNGMAWPKLDVQPTKYRFRLLNASDSRFYIFKLSNGASFQQIGTDGGLLNSPVTLNQLVLAPGERADIVINFAGMSGQSITLQNVGPDEPFKGLAAAQPAADPSTTGVIMQFKVGNNATASFNIPNNLRQPIQYLGAETNTRQLLLLEGMDQYGRLKPSLGTAADGKLGWVEPTTETPTVNDIEVWEVYNNTEDAHPIHIHQIAFQLVNRQEFTGDLDPVTSQLTNIQMVGSPMAPAANEQGWKDTYIVPPGQVARFKVKFDIPGKFVWHCHILSHEDWDMMRPMEVMPAPGGGGTGGSHCKVGDYVWHDSDGNGMHDSGEHGIGGVWVNLIDHLGNSHGWKMTDSNGYYEFDNIQPGDYKMKFGTPGGYIPTIKHAGSDHTKDSDIGHWTGITDLFTLVSGQWLKDCDAGYVQGHYLLADDRFQFEVAKHEEHAELVWTHNEGEAIETYTIEKSLDRVSFEPMYTAQSRGTASIEVYQGYDFEPAYGDNHYRVRMDYVDGRTGYSEVKTVNYADLPHLYLFPNPANQFVKANLEDLLGFEDVTITVYNNLGVAMKQFELDEVHSKYYQMDIRDLREGHYVVWFDIPGRRSIAKQLVVGKM